MRTYYTRAYKYTMWNHPEIPVLGNWETNESEYNSDILNRLNTWYRRAIKLAQASHT